MWVLEMRRLNFRDSSFQISASIRLKTEHTKTEAVQMLEEAAFKIGRKALELLQEDKYDQMSVNWTAGMWYVRIISLMDPSTVLVGCGLDSLP